MKRFLPCHKDTAAMILVLFTCFLANLVWWFPGVSNFDSNQQYHEAVSGHYSDWHPPIMALFWSVLRLVADGPGPLFFLHVFFYWLSFGLIARALHNVNYRKTAWAIIAVAVFPRFILMNVNIFKDVGLAVSFLASFAMIFWFRVQQKRVPIIIFCSSAILLFYGIMVRQNGIFGGAPLIIYMVRPALFGRPVRVLAVCLLIVFVTIPSFILINHKIIGASSAHPESSLEIFDVAGIAYFSGDMSVFEGENFSKDFISACYVPLFWDTLGTKKCRVISGAGYQHETRMWLEAILHHPLAYIEHRLAHFNEELGFVVSRHHADVRVRMVLLGTPPHVESVARFDSIVDYLEFNPLTAPVFYLVLGLVMLTIVYSKTLSALDQAALCLLLSGVLYGSAYLVIGCGADSDYRYQFWTMLSILTAFVVCMPKHAGCFRSPNSIDWVRIGILSITVITSLASRIVEGDALFLTG